MEIFQIFLPCLLFSLMNNVRIGFLLCCLTVAFRSLLANQGVDLLSTVADENRNVCLKKSQTFCSVAQRCSFFLMIEVGIGSIQFFCTVLDSRRIFRAAAIIAPAFVGKFELDESMWFVLVLCNEGVFLDG